MKHLIICDFDRTLADTFTPSPSGMEVSKAYDLAVLSVFGEAGFSLFRGVLGGIKNREPGELVRDLLLTAKALGIFLDKNGIPSDRLTEALVQKKLSFLLPRISKEWPRFYDGVKEFFDLAHQEELPIEIAIVSSGHDEFIRRAFEVNGLLAPSNLVTSDAIRRVDGVMNRPLHKPYPYQLALAHQRWLKNNNNDPSFDGFTGRGQQKPFMMFIGDDPVKDGELALRSRIPFGFVPFVNPSFIPDPSKGQMFVPDFKFFIRFLNQHRTALLEGKPFAEILFGVADRELFPPVREGLSASKERR